MKLTIGIATCGRPNILRRCLRSIRVHTHIDYEIIVLDNAKAFTDDPDAIPNISSKYKYIEVADNKIGCCESNNILQDNCATEYFMHLDDDVYINTDGFKSKRATLEEKPGGGVAVRIDLGTETEPPGTYEKNGRLTQPLPSETDLAQEIPQSLITQRGYEANLKSIETEDEMLDTLVHIIE